MLSALLVIFIGAGFAIDAKSFVSNALASAADVIVSVFIAFYLVDRISRRERLMKWEKVKSLSYRAIESTCDLIMFTFQIGPPLLATPTASQEESTPPRQKPLYERFLNLAEEITQRTPELSGMETIVFDSSIREPGWPQSTSFERREDGIITVSDEEAASSRREQMMHDISSQNLISRIGPDFEKLSLSIFPRILELDEETELITSFMEVESAYQVWLSNVDLIEGDWGMPEEFAWEAAAKFCEKMSTMLKIIYTAEPGTIKPMGELGLRRSKFENQTWRPEPTKSAGMPHERHPCVTPRPRPPLVTIAGPMTLLQISANRSASSRSSGRTRTPESCSKSRVTSRATRCVRVCSGVSASASARHLVASPICRRMAYAAARSIR